MRSMKSFLFAAAVAATTLLGAPTVAAQALEKQKITLAVGGKSLIYYLPLTIAENRLLVWRPAQGETEPL